MIVLDCSLTAADETATSWASATETDLRYLHFQGDLRLVVNGVDLSAPWGWIPVLDVAAGLRWAVAMLRTDGQAVYEFTESDDTVSFATEDRAPGSASVAVTASYAPGVGYCDLDELEAATGTFATAIVERLIADHKGLADNPFVRALR